MKTKLLLISMYWISMICFSQSTYVPDDNFENYLETHDASGNTVAVGDASSMGNGIANDDYVDTANINSITELNIAFKGISDLTGIEDFISLTELICYHNPYTSLDFSNNIALTDLRCGGDWLVSLDISQNTALIYFQCFGQWSPGTGLTSIDLSNHLALSTLDIQAFRDLTSLDLSHNTALTKLVCGYNGLTSLDLSQLTALEYLNTENNSLTSLDVSQNTVLNYLKCGLNQLTSLNVKNGNNINFSYFEARTNQLNCINVDDADYSTANWTNIDSQSYFSEDCSLGIEDQNDNAIKFYPNPINDIITIYSRERATFSVVDIKGQNILNGILTEGENRLDLSNLTSGLYFIKMKVINRENIMKILKQ